VAARAAAHADERAREGRGGRPHQAERSWRRLRADVREALGVAPQLVEHEPPDVRPELLVEPLLERERPAALRGITRVQRRLWLALLERRDDRRRIADALAAEFEHGERVVAAVRQPQRDGGVRAAYRGAQAIRDRLVVERPARLLAVVRDGDVPQRRLHSACHTDWSVGAIQYHKHMAPRAPTRSLTSARVDRRRRIARTERRDARQELPRAEADVFAERGCRDASSD